MSSKLIVAGLTKEGKAVSPEEGIFYNSHLRHGQSSLKLEEIVRASKNSE